MLVVGNVPVQEILAGAGGQGQVHALFRRAGVPHDALDLPHWAAAEGPGGSSGPAVFEVGDAAMRKMAGLKEDAGCHLAAELSVPEETNFAALPAGSLTKLLALDGVQDPGNLGTLLRSAAGMGWGGVFLLPGCCDPFNDKALRASRGAALSLPIQKGDAAALLYACGAHELQSLAASASGEDAERISRKQHNQGSAPGGGKGRGGVCLVLGSEGQGVSEEIRSLCREVAIPMAEGVESLNVGVAGGILMHIFRNSSERQ